MPVSQTTRSSASPLHRATANSPPPTTVRTMRSARTSARQQQHHNQTASDEGSPATSGAGSPGSPSGRGDAATEETSPSANGSSFGRMPDTRNNGFIDVTAGTTYRGRHITPTHDMAQSQLQMSEHEAAIMGGRSVGAPTPTSTSSYGNREDGAYGSRTARHESEFGGTDDGYGAQMMGGSAVGDSSMHGQASPQHYGQDGDDYDGMDATGGGGEGNEHDELGHKMKSEGEGQNPDGGPWTDTKTKAGKERKRLPLACIMCRRKKIRCSGEKPACKHCLRSRIPCVYKQTARKTIPRTDYMTMLDRRLKKMEERLLKCVPKEEINAMLANTGRSVVKPAITAAGKKRTAEIAFEDEFSNWTGSAAKQKRTPGGPTGPSQGAAPFDREAMENDDGSHALPPKEIQEHLAEVFFDFVYGQPYFLLHKPSFMRRLRSGTAPPVLVLALCAVSARFSKHPAVRHEPPFLAGECFAAEARRQLLKNFDNPNITNLTVCIILGLHEFGTCHGGRSWALGGMATRMAHALQLHKEAEQDPMGKVHQMMRPDYIHEGGLMGGYMSFTDKEIRRRCMWACFVMDRFNSSGTERPCMINEGEIEIQLPVHDRNLQLEAPAITEQLDGGVKDASTMPEEEKLAKAAESMGIGAYMVRAVAIFGRVVKYLNQGGKERDALEMWDPESHFNELNSELQQFIDDLPEQFRYNEANVQFQTAERTLPQFVFVHIAYHQIRLFLHRSTLSVAQNGSKASMPPEFANTARETALDAATNVAKILHDTQERGVSLYAPFMGYCAFNASLVHLVRMFHPQKDVQLEAKEHMETCLKFLLQLKQYWGLFRSITDQLKTLYRKFSASYSQISSEAGHAEVARMLQYGDWFTKYPQGFPPSEVEEYAPKPVVEQSQDDAALSRLPDLQTADEFFARLGPRLDTRQTRGASAGVKPPPPHFMQNSPDTHKSPASLGHVQSPMVPSNNPMPQASGLHGGPMAMNPQTMVPSPVNIGPKSDTSQHNRRTSISYPGGFSNPAQMPMAAGLPMNTSPQFASYPSSGVLPQGYRPAVSQEAHQTSQAPYLYESYTNASDAGLIAALSSSLWHGFDQPISTADVCAFPEHQTSSAWFMPFNSLPHHEYEDHSGLDALGMLASGAGALPTAEGPDGRRGNTAGGHPGYLQGPLPPPTSQ